MKIYLCMTKDWSRRAKKGVTLEFDESKGRRVIAAGFAKEVPDPKLKSAKKKADAKAAEKKAADDEVAKADREKLIAQAKEKFDAEAKAKAKTKAETATANPAAETADARPNLKGKSENKK